MYCQAEIYVHAQTDKHETKTQCGKKRGIESQ